MSHPSVHPLEGTPPLTNGSDLLPRVRMKDIQGMPGTPASLDLRMCQFGFAVVALSVMATISDFPTVTAFRYLVAAVSLQSLWSLSLTIVDIYALLVKCRLRNSRVVSLLTIGDGVLLAQPSWPLSLRNRYMNELGEESEDWGIEPSLQYPVLLHLVQAKINLPVLCSFLCLVSVYRDCGLVIRISKHIEVFGPDSTYHGDYPRAVVSSWMEKDGDVVELTRKIEPSSDITSTLTFAAASATAGITVLIDTMSTIAHKIIVLDSRQRQLWPL
ncbi:uncharacterized protein family [Actinidia rufa]|uniref:CASP-like protein n=1 Tax=Actinidia rufa TaxID=165716 RepID=A0A7J0DHZ4_9ERIC|nr:uncharacterized protein family [Actinidia rufa]